MSNLKCPICCEKIEHIEDGWCNCKNRCIGSGSISLWIELIRTSKALEIAVDALNTVTATPLNSRVIHDVANIALEQITATKRSELENLEMLVNNVFK